MKTEVERLEGCQVAFKIEVPASEVTKELATLYNDLQKKAKLPGFRQGKVPFEVLKTYFAQSVRADALDRLVSGAYQKALEGHDFIPCSQAKIEEVKYEENKPLSFKATTEIKPKITLKKYKGLKATRVIKIITDEDINHALERLQQRQAEFIAAPDRPTKKGDWIIIDFVGTKEGKPFQGNEAKNFSLEIGSKTLISDFEEQLEGLKKGEKKEIDVTFPTDYHNKELAATRVHFTVDLKEIKEKKLPKIDDAFAKDLKFGNLPELKEKVKDDLESYEIRHSENLVKENLMDWLIEKTPFPVPQAMVARELEVMIKEGLTRMRYSGMDPERMGIEETKLKEEYRPNAERRVKSTLILEQIAAQEGIVAGAAEIEKRIKEMVQTSGQKEEDLKEFFNKNRSYRAGLEEEVKLKKTWECIVQEAVIKEKKVKERRTK
jgi:trigger factor